MRYIKAFFNKVFITALLILIQAGWFVLFFMKLTAYSHWTRAFFALLSFIIAIRIIGKDQNSDYKISWIVLITILPLFGGLLYLCFGNKKPSKKMRAKLDKTHNEYLPQYVQNAEVLSEIEEDDLRMGEICSYLNKYSGFPVYGNTQTKYYCTGEEMFKDMLSELKGAEHFIFLEYFIIDDGIMWGQTLEILKEKVKQGVDVRLMYDDFGSLFLLPKDFTQQMEALGIKCMAFNPLVPFISAVMNNRDHRKILVIDGHTGFTGGINLSDEYINEIHPYGYWKDTGIMLKGDAVWSFTLMFLEMWNSFRHEDICFDDYRPHRWHKGPFGSDGYVQPFSDTPLDDENVGENIYIGILNQAKDYVYIYTPYLIPDNEMKTAMCLAAKRGVDVRLVTPRVADKKMVHRLTKSYYRPLLKAGVRIYEFSPGFIHAKSYVCDDIAGVVGTINMDFRSLYLHFECAAFFYKSSSVMQLKEDCLRTIERSTEVSEDICSKGFFPTLLDSVLRLIAPLL